MSFVNILKKIGGVVTGVATVEHQIAPFLKLVPGVGAAIAVLDPVIDKLATAIKTAELNVPGDGQGGLKSDAVVANFQADLDSFSSFADAAGYTVTYDDPLLKETISKFVTAYNSASKLKSSIKLSPKAN